MPGSFPGPGFGLGRDADCYRRHALANGRGVVWPDGTSKTYGDGSGRDLVVRINDRWAGGSTAGVRSCSRDR